jgi:hypothetical protein
MCVCLPPPHPYLLKVPLQLLDDALKLDLEHIVLLTGVTEVGEAGE